MSLTLVETRPTLEPMTFSTRTWAWPWRHERGGSVA